MDDPADSDPIYGTLEFGVGLYTDKEPAIDGLKGYVRDDRWDKDEAEALVAAIEERRNDLLEYGYCRSFSMDTRLRPDGPKLPMDYDFYIEKRYLYSTPGWDKPNDDMM